MARITVGKRGRKTPTKYITDSERAKLYPYKTKDAAVYLGYSEGGIRKLVSLGILPSIKIGRDARYSKEDLDNYYKYVWRPRGRPVRPTKPKLTQAERKRIRERGRQLRAKQRNNSGGKKVKLSNTRVKRSARI